MTTPYRKPSLASLVRRRRRVTTAALNALAGWGYEEAEVPLLVPYDALRGALPSDAQDLFRFTDREGRLLLLRSDLTPIIAWQLSRSLDTRTMPVRVCYANRVARIQRAFAGERVESHEIGAELFGAPGLAGDLECLTVAWDTLSALGLDAPEFHVGNVEIAELIIAAAESADSEALRAAIGRRDRSTVRELGASLEPRLTKALGALCAMRPSAADIEAVRASGVAGIDASLAHLDALVDGLHTLGVDRVVVDLSARSERRYYTGLYFRVLADSAAGPIAAGGRYDRLLADFGQPACAVGFAIQVENVIDLLESREGGDASVEAGAEYSCVAQPTELVTALGKRRSGIAVRVVYTTQGKS